MLHRHISFEEGWTVLEEGITIAKRILQGDTDARPTAAEFMKFYDCAYKMATQKTGYCKELYDGYKSTLRHCSQTMVLPRLVNLQGESFFVVLVQMWLNYKLMSKLIASFLCYIERVYIPHAELAPLDDVAATCFFAPVRSMFGDQIRGGVLYMMRQERDADRFGSDLLKSSMDTLRNSDMFDVMKNGILEDTAAYYHGKASEWIIHYPLKDYLLKVDDAMKKERMRLAYYLFLSEEQSWVVSQQVVYSPLMTTYETHSRSGGQSLLQMHLAIEHELLPMCSGMTLGDGNMDNKMMG